jgi:enolase-phosphatase E1
MSAWRLYLLDIEGTVAPLSLTSEQLFPYARQHFAEFLEKTVGDAGVDADLALLAEENRAETDSDAPCLHSGESSIGESGIGESSEELRAPSFRLSSGERVGARNTALVYLLWLMDRDRKSTALKSLQGKIWKAGFEGGALKGTLFADVPEAFARWAPQGKIALYSSGSVEAQRLLFRYSNYGDLTPMIAGYFDTRTGPKKESTSYAAIAAAMGVAPAEAIFFSDVVPELDAARGAGFATRLVVREGNAAVEDAHGHCAVESLERILGSN